MSAGRTSTMSMSIDTIDSATSRECWISEIDERFFSRCSVEEA